MLDSLPIDFWYIAVAVTTTLLVYRAYRRRKANRSLATLPQAYARGTTMLSGSPQSADINARAEFLIPWAIQQVRGNDKPVDPTALTSRELRFAELVHAAVVLDERAFKAACGKVSAVEEQVLELVRGIAAQESRVTLEQLKGNRLQERVRKALAPRPLLPIALAAVPAATERDEAFPIRFKQVSELLGWLPGNSDPDLWHLLVANLNYDYEDTLKVVFWIISQPDCDRATAALAIFLISPDAYMGYETLEECEGWDRHYWLIAKTICERSEAGLYPQSRFNLSCVNVDNDQTGTLDMLLHCARDLAEHGKTIPWPMPVKLLSQPFEGRDAVSATYLVNDDTIYHRA